ncbi:MAG: DUF3786 domain-containing protein, partial [Anaerolineae bacterium]|nr:DUF3786 domain-containing protein [Anaerolineae bacterium]
ALEKARRDLQQLDPHAVALRTGSRSLRCATGQAVELAYWGRDLQIAWETGEVRPLSGGSVSIPVQLIVLHYLITADGTPLADRWLSFRELPDGRVYDAAFRKRACEPLARVFGQRPAALAAAGRRLGGEVLSFGDVSFLFHVLPRVRVATILHAADDEFPAEANVLFDASMRHYLPIEDVAVLGGLVAGELIRASREGR